MMLEFLTQVLRMCIELMIVIGHDNSKIIWMFPNHIKTMANTLQLTKSKDPVYSESAGEVKLYCKYREGKLLF